MLCFCLFVFNIDNFFIKNLFILYLYCNNRNVVETFMHMYQNQVEKKKRKRKCVWNIIFWGLLTTPSLLLDRFRFLRVQLSTRAWDSATAVGSLMLFPPDEGSLRSCSSSEPEPELDRLHRRCGWAWGWGTPGWCFWTEHVPVPELLDLWSGCCRWPASSADCGSGVFRWLGLRGRWCDYVKSRAPVGTGDPAVGSRADNTSHRPPYCDGSWRPGAKSGNLTT